MEIYLYYTPSNYRVINKTLLNETLLEIVLKKEIDLYKPTLYLSKNVEQCNYIKMFNNYYFISERNLTTNKKIMQLDLTKDVLMSNKELILNSYANVNHKIRKGDYNLETPYLSEQTETLLYNSDTELKPTNSIILTTIGGLNSQGS